MTSSATPGRARRLAAAACGALGGIVALCSAAPLLGQSFERRLRAVLDRPPLDRHLWGVAVLDGRGRLLFDRNAERLFTPASNTKLVVTAVATGLLPPGWTVRTSVYGTGPVTDGRLQGDLVLYGRGDPTIGRRCFAIDTLAPGSCNRDPAAPFRVLAGGLKQAGIREVAGDVVGDGSYFEPLRVHPTWENDDLVFGYAAPVSGLGFNENSVLATVRPGPAPGAPPLVTLEPFFPGFELVIRAVTVPDGQPTSLTWTRRLGASRYTVEGTIASSTFPRRELLSVDDPNWFAAQGFAQVLADSGIRVRGLIRGTADSLEYPIARRSAPLAEVESRPLSDWIFAILNVSQNWYAEMLLKQLGRQFGTAGSWESGIEIERRFLIDEIEIDSTQFRLHDGSGLSAKDLVTPLAFARILYFMRRQPRFPTFVAGIPRSGEIGTLRTRFVSPAMAGRVRAKTGSIGQVNTLSGYLVPTADSSSIAHPACRIFSVQANHHALGGRTMIRAIDSLVAVIDAPCRRSRKGRRSPR